MCGGHSAVAAISTHNSIYTIILAMMLLAFEGCNHLVNKVIDIEKFHLYASVIDLDRKIVRNIIAKGGNSRIIVRPTPLAEKIRETINKNFSTGIFRISEGGIISG